MLFFLKPKDMHKRIEYKLNNGMKSYPFMLEVDKKLISIKFEPRYNAKAGFYSTESPLIQNALSMHPKFGIDFIVNKSVDIENSPNSIIIEQRKVEVQNLSEETEIERLLAIERELSEKRKKLQVEIEEKKKVEPKKDNEPKKSEEDSVDESAMTALESPVNAQQAKEALIMYCKENGINLDKRGLNDVTAIINKGKSIGVVFPNLK